MESWTERITVGTTSEELFRIRARELHNVLIRPLGACEISFRPFAFGKGLRLDAKEPYALNWRDFRHIQEDDWIGIYAAVSADTTTVDVMISTR